MELETELEILGRKKVIERLKNWKGQKKTVDPQEVRQHQSSCYLKRVSQTDVAGAGQHEKNYTRLRAGRCRLVPHGIPDRIYLFGLQRVDASDADPRSAVVGPMCVVSWFVSCVKVTPSLSPQHPLFSGSESRSRERRPRLCNCGEEEKGVYIKSNRLRFAAVAKAVE